jgi:hypothetical protein
MRVPVASYVFVAGLIFCAAAPAEAAADTSLTSPAVCAAGHDPELAGVFAGPLPAPAPAPLPTPLDTEGEKVFDEQSYRDVFSVLRAENECSRFFGGPAKSLEAFNEFARRLEKKPVGGRNVVLRMEGTYANFRNVRTGATYRIFERATINSAGPFFRRAGTADEGRMRVGRFAPGTRQARALVLLHELGHLVEGDDGRWLLPNDGEDAALSERNTRKVEDQCLEQLLALDR